MRQMRLHLDLGGKSPGVEFRQQVRRKLVELMAQTIIAVHQGLAKRETRSSEARSAQLVEADDDD